MLLIPVRNRPGSKPNPNYFKWLKLAQMLQPPTLAGIFPYSQHLNRAPIIQLLAIFFYSVLTTFSLNGCCHSHSIDRKKICRYTADTSLFHHYSIFTAVLLSSNHVLPSMFFPPVATVVWV